MDAVLRAAAVYALIWLILRAAGKRALAEITTFDFVLLLILSESTQSFLTSDNNSFTNLAIILVTMIGIDIVLSVLAKRSKALDFVLDGGPLVILEHGLPIAQRLKDNRIDVDDILARAREASGLARLDQIRYAVLERDGQISIIPEDSAR